VTDRPRLRLSTVVLDAPDPHALADFYRRLLGWEIVAADPTWVKLEGPDGGAGLAVQLEPLYAPPTWPSRPDAQQMMSHLDIQVEDLEAGGAHAVAQGATLAEFQPQDDVRVYLDPMGHPFCLWA
jgi:catechol 2,3-dioxygenase-like lactoylglutathione lyase family enzyme